MPRRRGSIVDVPDRVFPIDDATRRMSRTADGWLDRWLDFSCFPRFFLFSHCATLNPPCTSLFIVMLLRVTRSRAVEVYNSMCRYLRRFLDDFRRLSFSRLGKKNRSRETGAHTDAALWKDGWRAAFRCNGSGKHNDGRRPSWNVSRRPARTALPAGASPTAPLAAAGPAVVSQRKITTSPLLINEFFLVFRPSGRLPVFFPLRGVYSRERRHWREFLKSVPL